MGAAENKIHTFGKRCYAVRNGVADNGVSVAVKGDNAVVNRSNGVVRACPGNGNVAGLLAEAGERSAEGNRVARCNFVILIGLSVCVNAALGKG